MKQENNDPNANLGQIPAGHYAGRAVYRKPEDATWGTSSGKHPQVGLSFEITEGAYKGRRYPWYGTFAEGEATRITLDSLGAAGAKFETDDIFDLTGLGDVECMLVISHRVQQKYDETTGELVDVLDEETGQPRMIPQIQYINAAGGARMKDVMNVDDKAAFREMMRGTLQNRGAKDASKVGVPTGANGKPLF